ncbi:MAG: HNH endonuclease [Deltaproteobacteria bacterium]|nr:HNH endonuclease [Deltaproteobacteria bacterium]
MAFSETTVVTAWKNAGGKCERCGKSLVWENRGRETGYGAWEAHHATSVQSSGGDYPSNCKILCWSCHKKTF